MNTSKRKRTRYDYPGLWCATRDGDGVEKITFYTTRHCALCAAQALSKRRKDRVVLKEWDGENPGDTFVWVRGRLRMGAKPRGPRPKAEKFDAYLSTKLRKADAERIKIVAESLGMSPAEWARQVMLEALQRQQQASPGANTSAELNRSDRVHSQV